MLRENDKGKKGATGEKPDERNQYNQNFQNRFCGCEDEYDPQQQSGTMYQCIGLNGGCGEDWWHPTCIVGLDSSWYKRAVKDHKKAKEAAKKAKAASKPATSTSTDTVAVGESAVDEEDDDEDDGPVPPGFPDDNMFESFICYKCVEAQPWIKKYAGAPGFLEPVFRRSLAPSPEDAEKVEVKKSKDETVDTIPIVSTGLKRKADDDDEESSQKKAKTDTATVAASASTSAKTCTVVSRPTPTGTFSLCCITDFRTKLCRCGDCFPLLASHPQLLDEEDIYEPPMSETSSVHGASGGGSVASLLDRGERALSTMDRVKAIEGVMAFNKLKEGLTPFFREFAETGKVISAEDVKRHFAKMRGDDGNGLNEFPDGQAR